MEFKLVGSPCGQHGPYTFYKAFRYTKNGRTSILSLSEFFFVKLWTDSDLISIGELQLLWEDRNSEQTLASLRLYILPENTPDGRCDVHGEDEVLAITEKVVLRVEDLLTWITQANDWNWGLGAVWERDCPEIAPTKDGLPTTGPNRIAIDMEDIDKEKKQLDAKHWETNTGVVVLSYPRYCRYRGILKRLEGVHNKWLRTGLVVALGGFTAPCKNTRVLFCKDTFDYPELEGHELLCNHLAPKLKGRPRRKRKKLSVSPEGSESESESSQSTSSSQTSKPKIGLVKPRLRCTLEVKRTTRGPNTEEKNFLNSLQVFMNERKTPIGRIPIVGFKEVNLFKLYRKVIELGGYDVVCSGKMWKHVYEVMGGDSANTSAATLSRRHYEKLLLPYERHLSGKSYVGKTASKSIPAATGSPPEPKQELKHTPKSSSLRSIRLKQEKVATVGEKENIPQKVMSPPPQPVVKSEPEVIDLVSDDAPIKAPAPPLAPMVKKQKLEILKEGGLEVTPIGGGRVSVIKLSGGGASVTPVLPPPAPPPPPLPPAKPPVTTPMKPPPPVPPTVNNNNNNKKISITVTPDMTHLMYPPGPSKKPVYGNPKELLSIQQKKSCGVAPEVLDLRTKPKIHSPHALTIGSNLEITLVPPGKSRQAMVMAAPPPKKRPPQQPPMYLHQQRATLIVPQRPPPTVYNNHQRHQHMKSTPPAPSPGAGYIPLVDPIYLSALYNGIFAPPVFQTGEGHHHHHHQGASPSGVRTTAADHLAVYKELIRRQGMFPLLQDGSTSITLVGQPTPTSK